jgi:hypothetical protein
MLLALLACLGLQIPDTATQIQARVPNTNWVVVLLLKGWKDASDPDPLRQEIPEKLVLSGTMDPPGTILTLIAEPNPQALSPGAWRKHFAVPGEVFDIQLSACVDASVQLENAPAFSDYHAYSCAAGYCFDLHVSRVSPNAKLALPRAEFERIVQTTRVLLLRRGWAEDYPSEVSYQMTLAALAGPGRPGWKEQYLPKHAGEWTAQFVEAEFLRYDKAPAEQQIACYQKSLELLGKLEKPGPKERFGWAIACDGLSLALYDAKRFADSLAPLEKGYALLAELERKERASLAYNLACSQALLKHEPEALVALGHAIEVDPRFRESAAKDEDFALLRVSPEFQKLLAKPPPSPAK